VACEFSGALVGSDWAPRSSGLPSCVDISVDPTNGTQASSRQSHSVSVQRISRRASSCPDIRCLPIRCITPCVSHDEAGGFSGPSTRGAATRGSSIFLRRVSQIPSGDPCPDLSPFQNGAGRMGYSHQLHARTVTSRRLGPAATTRPGVIFWVPEWVCSEHLEGMIGLQEVDPRALAEERAPSDPAPVRATGASLEPPVPVGPDVLRTTVTQLAPDRLCRHPSYWPFGAQGGP
jgi:hypothetical protein